MILFAYRYYVSYYSIITIQSLINVLHFWFTIICNPIYNLIDESEMVPCDDRAAFRRTTAWAKWTAQDKQLESPSRANRIKGTLKGKQSKTPCGRDGTTIATKLWHNQFSNNIYTTNSCEQYVQSIVQSIQKLFAHFEF